MLHLSGHASAAASSAAKKVSSVFKDKLVALFYSSMGVKKEQVPRLAKYINRLGSSKPNYLATAIKLYWDFTAMKELGYALSQVVHNTFGKGIVGPENWNSNAGLKLIGRCTSAKRLDGVCKKINMIMDERPSYVASKNMGEAARLQNITWTGFIIKADKEWWHQIMTTYKQSKKGLVPSSYLQASDLCLWANNVDECPFVPSESDPLIDPNTNLTRFPHFTSYHYSHLQKNPYQSSSWLQKHVLPICVLKFQASLDKCSTCCCQDGLIKQQLQTTLVIDTDSSKGLCPVWFQTLSEGLRLMFTAIRMGQGIEWAGTRCYQTPKRWGRKGKKMTACMRGGGLEPQGRSKKLLALKRKLAGQMR